MTITASQLRKAYIEFFKKHDHAEIGSAPLVPENDPTVLFTTAGMHPLVPFLLGQQHPAGNRLVNCQKCIRTGDIEDVGDTTHLTFFEMLGNWSLGDYFKEEAIAYSFEFLTSELNIPLSRLWISCFAGDEDAPRDDEAASVWRRLGVPEEKIVFLDKTHNWWGPAGQTGPCGPDTEMFVELDQPPCGPACDVTCGCGKYVEIWNDVFMQYNKNEHGDYEPMERKNVDTGMGLERVTAVLQGRSSCYETELFAGFFQCLSELIKQSDPAADPGGRMVADHIRAATFLLGDGVKPGNIDQGYVLRRLIRRAVRRISQFGVKEVATPRLARVFIDEYSQAYPELSSRAEMIAEELRLEEEQFAEALQRGIREFNKLVEKFPADLKNKVISGRKAFFLYETYGFPLELTEEMAHEQGLAVDREGFEKAYRKHQEQSRSGAEKRFKGGLADQSAKTTRLHTATHLLHEALRRELGEHVQQAGSNINAERLRFDFTHGEKLSKEQLRRVENTVNAVIQENLPIEVREMSIDEAQRSGAVGIFGERYGERVKVYRIGDFSAEICGGPHVERTGDLGGFKITKEESSSRGVRRIKAELKDQPEANEKK